LAARVNAPVQYGSQFDFANCSRAEPVISTIPMPNLMAALSYPERSAIEFRHVGGCNINATVVGCDAYCTIYVPDPSLPFNRISLTGGKLTIELANYSSAWLRELSGVGLQTNMEALLREAASMLGISNMNHIVNVLSSDQRYAKIQSIDDSARKRFMLWATENYNIYSLGRFATWSPKILLDDCVKDVRVIRRMIGNGHNYEARI